MALEQLETVRRERLAQLRGALVRAAKEHAEARAAVANAASKLAGAEGEIARLRSDFGRAPTVRALQRAEECQRALTHHAARLRAEHTRLTGRLQAATASLRLAEDAVRTAGIDVRAVERARERRTQAVSRRTEERAEDELEAAFRARIPR